MTGLAPGRFELKIDGQSVGTFADAELAKGVNLARYRTPMRWQAYSVKWSVGGGHEAAARPARAARRRREGPVAAGAADALAARDEAVQKARPRAGDAEARRYELVPVR